MASNEAGLNEITGDDITEPTATAILNSLSVPVPDMVGHPLTQSCRQWEWFKAVLKSQVDGKNKSSEDQCSSVRLRDCDCGEQCQQCQVLLLCCRQLNANLPRWRFLLVVWYAIEETGMFLSCPDTPLHDICTTLSAIEGIPNPWNLQGQLPSTESTWSSACVRLVRRWLDDCINNHRSCGSAHNPVLPTRVLDLGLDASTRVSLWEPRGRTGRYACLSYCWGKSEFTVTTQDNLKDHLERGIDLKDLPQTFQDAIEVVRKLKVRYLWIDALCIIQNEDHHEDWKRECGNMSSIYRNSHLTLAAAWAKSANSGCFITPDPGVACGPVMMRKVPHFPILETPEVSTDFPIITRAWTFQERLLAPRVIYFCRQEIVWDCIEMHTCECGGATYPVPGVRKVDLHIQDSTRSGGEFWRRLVREYSTLQLTCPDDKLPALSGLAQAMTLRSQESYLAGLWKDTLLADMCWNVKSSKAKEPHQTRWRAPSWSWSSVDGPIQYCLDLTSKELREYRKEHALVREAKCTPAGPSLTGEVEDGFVTLDAFLIPASFDATDIHADCSELKLLRLKWFPDRASEIEEMPVIYVVPMMTTCNGFLWKFHGLVVKAYGQGTEMARVGLATCIVGDCFKFFDCEKQIIKIV